MEKEERSANRAAENEQEKSADIGSREKMSAEPEVAAPSTVSLSAPELGVALADFPAHAVGQLNLKTGTILKIYWKALNGWWNAVLIKSFNFLS